MSSRKLTSTKVLDKLNSFRKKLNAAQNKESDESNWMSNKLKFHIDSARAYSHFENKEKAGGFVKEKETEPPELRPRSKYLFLCDDFEFVSSRRGPRERR